MAAPRTDRVAQKRSRIIRRIVLAASLALATGLAFAHQYPTLVGFKAAPVDALCPFGGIETLYSLIAGGALLQKVAAGSIVVLIGSVLLALVFRRSFCGQVCPLGAMQGAFGWLRSKFRIRRFEIPAKLDRVARYLKYVILVVLAAWTWQAATLVIRPYDPWAAWAHITSAEVLTSFGIGLAVLGVSLIGSFVYDRFFCKYLCPMGGFLGVFSRVSLLGIRRDTDTCIDCKACDKACPMNVAVSTADTVTSSECISCNECVNACPVADTLEVRTAGATSKRLSPLLATAIVLAVLLGTVGVASALGQFSFTQPTVAEAVEQSGGAFDTSLIKGSSSLGEVAEATGIPRTDFSAAFGVPEAELDRPLKEIKDTYGFTPEDVRAWVAERLGIEITTPEGHGSE